MRVEKKRINNEKWKVLIIVPTRELVIQIMEVANVLVKQFSWIVCGSLMGGESKKKEKARLRKGIQVLVATPGRLLDHLNNTQSFITNNLKTLILDEADRLLDLGFDQILKQIVFILEQRLNAAPAPSLPTSPTPSRQNVLISATLDSRIQKLANFILSDPVFINLADSSYSSPGYSLFSPSSLSLSFFLPSFLFLSLSFPLSLLFFPLPLLFFLLPIPFLPLPLSSPSCNLISSPFLPCFPPLPSFPFLPFSLFLFPFLSCFMPLYRPPRSFIPVTSLLFRPSLFCIILYSICVHFQLRKSKGGIFPF